MIVQSRDEQTIDQRPSTSATPSRSRVWWWVCAAFVVQITVWTLWIVIASHNRVEEVPLATVESRP